MKHAMIDLDYEELTEFEFYMLTRFAIAKLPERVRKEIAGLQFFFHWNLINWNDDNTPMAEWNEESKSILLYPHLIIYDAAVRKLSVADSLISIIEHEVAHIYKIDHAEIVRRRKEKISMFDDIKFPYKK